MLKKAVISAACLTAFMSATPAMADRDTNRYTSLTVFGDSLVDAGNISVLSGGTTPSAALGYFNGRFTNGYDYTDLLSIDLFGTPTAPSLLGGSNYAFGGARVTTTSPVPDLAEQFGMFQMATGGITDPNGLYVLNFGGNDLFNAPAGFPDNASLATAAANMYAMAVQQLNDWGARNILVTGFPPAGTNFALILDAETKFQTALAGLSLDSDTSLFTFSYLGFYQAAQIAPATVGLPALNFATNCIAAGAQASGCAGFFSFDGIHPTAQVQQAAYNVMNAQFGLTAWQAVPEPGTWAMMILGFGMIGAAMRKAKRQVTVRYA